MAFAMKLAAKQAELAACPYVSEQAKGQLEATPAPRVRLVTVTRNGSKLAVGNETVLFRHEKTFYHAPGLFVRVRDRIARRRDGACCGSGRVQGGFVGPTWRLMAWLWPVKAAIRRRSAVP